MHRTCPCSIHLNHYHLFMFHVSNGTINNAAFMKKNDIFTNIIHILNFSMHSLQFPALYFNFRMWKVLTANSLWFLCLNKGYILSISNPRCSGQSGANLVYGPYIESWVMMMTSQNFGCQCERSLLFPWHTIASMIHFPLCHLSIKQDIRRLRYPMIDQLLFRLNIAIARAYTYS